MSRKQIIWEIVAGLAFVLYLAGVVTCLALAAV